MTTGITAEAEATRIEAIAFAIAEIEQTGPLMFHTSLAPKTAGEYMSSEATSVVITKDHGRWWVKVETAVGSKDYPAIEAAKRAAAELVVDSQETMEHDIVNSLKVDTDDWDAVLDNGSIILKSKHDAREIVGSNVTETWALYDGEDLVCEDESFLTVLQCRSVRPSLSAPRM